MGWSPRRRAFVVRGAAVEASLALAGCTGFSEDAGLTAPSIIG